MAEDEQLLSWDDLERLSPPQRTLLEARAAWIEKARPEQLCPQGGDWVNWLFLAGRGSGKTRSVAEETWYQCSIRPNTRWAYVAPTSNDLRRTVFEGESGLLACTPKEALRGGSVAKAYNRSLFELYFSNGSVIQGFSAEQPNRLRGPQFHACSAEELAAWDDGAPDAAWDILDLAVRLPPFPRFLIATTPRPIPLIRKLAKDKQTVVSRSSTYANRANLAKQFLERILKYDGTAYGRQEIYGEILSEDEGSIYARAWFKVWPRDRMLPVFSFVFLSIDGALSERETADKSACSAWGIFRVARKTSGGVWLPSKPCLMLLDLWAERLRFPDLVAKVDDEAFAAVYGGSKKRLPDGRILDGQPGRAPDLALIENKASGISLAQSLQDKDRPVELWDPGRMDKAMRAHAGSPYALSGQVWVPETYDPEAERGTPSNWAMPMIDQACGFTGDPKSLPHDDELDTMTMSLCWSADQGYLSRTGIMGEEGASEAMEGQSKDPRLWAAVEDGDIGYGVQKRSTRRLDRSPYDGD